MLAILERIEDNNYYVLYKAKLDKNDIGEKYSIYRTKEFGGDYLKSFRYLAEARKVFNKVTKEALNYDKELFGRIGEI